MRPLLVLLPLVLALSACGGSSSGSGAGSSGGSVLQTIKISEKEFSLTPSTASLAKPGTYEFDISNDGTVTHSFEVEGNGVEQKAGDVQAGSSTTLRVDLTKEGSYEMYCPIDGHKQQGMKGTITVGGAGATGGMTTNKAPTTTSSGTTTTTGGGYGY
jgi:uncharacterized cupredoxin-like copper-binding protein